jgi:hypothetical protein
MDTRFGGLLLVATLLVAVTDGFAADALDPARVAVLTKLLPPRPVGLGPPASDRKAWAELGTIEAVRAAIASAESSLKEPLPEQTDDLFLEFSRTGNRTNWERVAWQRRGRLTPLVLAECVENQGRFLPALEELIGALCAEKTWVMPAHDENLANFRGEAVDIDLASSDLAWQLATADWLLGSRLRPGTRALVRARIAHFVLDPYLAMIRGERPLNWWLTTTNNWNAVCLAGVTGAALAQLESADARAEVVAAAEHYSRNFLAGFPPDGYCTEGLGYWDYGFGNYVLLCETLWQATGGGVDLFALSEARMPAQFGARIEIINGVSPAFADCDVEARPEPTTMWYANRRLGLGLSAYDTLDPQQVAGSLTQAMLFLLPNSASQARGPAAASAEPTMRTWFDQAGILIGRPRPGSECRMGVALKGGHNNEHHNHNDLGSYVVVVGDRPVLLDPGAEVYTARTFSDRRYESNLLNSYGHPVPVLAGKLQEPGAERRAKVVRADLTDAADTLELDLTSAYAVPELKSLRRTFVYSREGQGQLTVTDRVQFATPQTYATALVTLGKCLPQGPNELFLYDVDQAVKIRLDTGGRAFTLHEEEIKEDGARPLRIGLALSEPVTEATVTVSIVPAGAPGSDRTVGLLRNGGFEARDWCWELPRDGKGEISDEQAASGRYSLKITDTDEQTGSNLRSARIAVTGAGEYVLRGQVFHASASGIGVYVCYYDTTGRSLNPSDEKGDIAPVGALEGKVGQWVPFTYPFTTPAGTAAIRLWIHSYNAAQVTAYLDDLEILPAPLR